MSTKFISKFDQRLNELKNTIKEGWCGSNSLPISDVDLVLCDQVLSLLSDTILPTQLYASPEGGIDLTWDQFEISITSKNLFIRMWPPNDMQKSVNLNDISEKVSFIVNEIYSIFFCAHRII